MFVKHFLRILLSHLQVREKNCEERLVACLPVHYEILYSDVFRKCVYNVQVS